MKKYLFVAATASLALTSAPTLASTVIKSYEFSATTPGPITNHSGSLSFSYDDANPTVLTLQSINFSLGSYIFDLGNTGIVYYNNGSGDGFVVGGTACSVTCAVQNTNDFWVVNSPNAKYLRYTQVGYSGAHQSQNDVEFTQIAGAVPEPATWAFMIFGFGAIGGAMRRQRKTTMKVSYA